MGFVLNVILALFLVVLSALYARYRYMGSKFPGGLEGNFIQGTIGLEMEARGKFQYLEQFLLPRLKRYGPITACLGPVGTGYVVRSADAGLNSIIFQQLEKPKPYGSVGKFVGKGLFGLMDVEKWHAERKKLAHAFSDKCSRDQLKSTRKNISKMLDKFGDGGEFNVHLEFKYALLDAVTSWNFNVSFDSINHPETPEVSSLMKINSALEELLLQFLIPFRKLYASRKAKVTDQIVDECRSIGRKIVREGLDRAKTEVDDRKNKTIFHQMLRIEGLSEDELVEHALTFIGAGHETSASGAASLIHLLATNPDCMKKAREEVDSVMGSAGERVPSSERPLSDFPYLTSCVKETLRLQSPAGDVFRVMKDTVTYKGYTFSKGTEMGADIASTHHNPTYYPDPFTYKPERFSVEEEKKLPAGAFLPFGMGQRNCIGYRLALFSMVLIGASVIRNFDVIAKNTPTYRRLFVTEPNDGVLVQLTPRSHL